MGRRVRKALTLIHDFDTKLAESDNDRVRALVHKALHERFGNDYLAIHKAALDNDRHGADYFAEFRHGLSRLIEVKVRVQDWLPRGQDADLALETWADLDKHTVGWTRDMAKLSDYVVFLWLESGRSLLLDARLLRAWFSETWQTLRGKYGARIIPSKRRGREWRSEALYIPHADVVAQLARRQGYVQKPLGSRQSGSERHHWPRAT
ncbi:MAG TPA: hypothetical protein VFC18_02315 [Burkholderiales bacterium]|nr:hypothetical protein [Burkholderiales bacterium]